MPDPTKKKKTFKQKTQDFARKASEWIDKEKKEWRKASENVAYRKKYGQVALNKKRAADKKKASQKTATKGRFAGMTADQVRAKARADAKRDFEKKKPQLSKNIDRMLDEEAVKAKNKYPSKKKKKLTPKKVKSYSEIRAERKKKDEERRKKQDEAFKKRDPKGYARFVAASKKKNK